MTDTAQASALIGPGRLVLVAGPSGAGKDSLIAAAAAALQTNARFVFPTRVVTRESSTTEANDSLNAAAFATARASGAFALSWDAHGLGYGIPSAIDVAIAAGQTVICNVSRTVVTQARQRYRHVTYIEVSAPLELLRARLIARGRESAADIDHRLSRQVTASDAAAPDVTIINDRALDDAVRQFLAAVGAI